MTKKEPIPKLSLAEIKQGIEGDKFKTFDEILTALLSAPDIVQTAKDRGAINPNVNTISRAMVKNLSRGIYTGDPVKQLQHLTKKQPTLSSNPENTDKARDVLESLLSWLGFDKEKDSALIDKVMCLPLRDGIKVESNNDAGKEKKPSAQAVEVSVKQRVKSIDAILKKARGSAKTGDINMPQLKKDLEGALGISFKAAATMSETRNDGNGAKTVNKPNEKHLHNLVDKTFAPAKPKNRPSGDKATELLRRVKKYMPGLEDKHIKSIAQLRQADSDRHKTGLGSYENPAEGANYRERGGRY